MGRPSEAGTGGLRIGGYAALFDIVDRGGDIVRKGAFSKSGGNHPPLHQQGVALLWQHDPTRLVGMIDQLREDGRGLRVVARLSQATAAGREAIRRVLDGSVRGLSFGYRIRTAREHAKGGSIVRELCALDLIEISLVTAPMQPGARVEWVEQITKDGR